MSQRTENKEKGENKQHRKAEPLVVVVSAILGEVVGPIAPVLEMKLQPSGSSEFIIRLNLRITVRNVDQPDRGEDRNVNRSLLRRL